MIVVVTDLARMERRVYEDVGGIVEGTENDEPRIALAFPNGDEVELHPYRQRIEVIA